MNKTRKEIQKMKIKVTIKFKWRKFIAESDDDLQNMYEVEALSDILSALNYAANDVYDMCRDSKRVEKEIRWNIEYGDISIANSDNVKYDDVFMWSDIVRIIVYALVRTVYSNRIDICYIPSYEKCPPSYCEKYDELISSIMGTNRVKEFNRQLLMNYNKFMSEALSKKKGME